jgi:mono/diheme cytochrome c family protein
LKTFLRILKWVGLALFAGVVVLAVFVSVTWNKDWDVPAPDLHASTDAAMIARGEYLVYGPAHCVECHVSKLAEYDRFYETGAPPAMSGGYKFLVGPLGTLYSKNITPDPETGIGRYSDPQVARMLRHGVRPNNKASIPQFMPFSEMSDEDVIAILSFLRAQPPVRNAPPENEWTLFGKVMKSFVSAAKPRMDGHPPKTSPSHHEVSVARGQYLDRSVADCGGCHTPFNEMTGAATGPRLSGGSPMEPVLRDGVDKDLWFTPPNITPLPGSALRKFPDRATFIARFKNGGRQYAGSPMPWEGLARMTNEDIGSLYEYLMAQRVSGEKAPTDPRVKH